MVESHDSGVLFGLLRALALGRRLVAGFRQIVGDGQRGHDDEPLVADLAERLAHFADLLIDQAGERLESRLFARLQARRYLRPSMVTETCDMARASPAADWPYGSGSGASRPRTRSIA